MGMMAGAAGHRTLAGDVGCRMAGADVVDDYFRGAGGLPLIIFLRRSSVESLLSGASVISKASTRADARLIARLLMPPDGD